MTTDLFSYFLRGYRHGVIGFRVIERVIKRGTDLIGSAVALGMMAAVVYLHPYELDQEAPELDTTSMSLPERLRYEKLKISQYHGRARTETKLRHLLGRYRFDSIRGAFDLETLMGEEGG